MSADINVKTLDFVSTANKALGVAMKMAEDVEATQVKVASKVPATVASLKRAGLIDDGDEKRAAEQLSNAVQSLDILNNVLDHYQGQLKDAQAKVASATMGEGVADADSNGKSRNHQKNANYTGYRRGLGEKSASDEALLRLIDGYRPGV